MKCQVGCTTDEILAVYGLPRSALFPPKNGAAGPARPRSRKVARYDYHNADGSLAYYVERTADKSFPTYRPDG